MYTVNVEIFAQYIFSRISRRAVDARNDHAPCHYLFNCYVDFKIL